MPHVTSVRGFAPLAALALLGACTTVPTGPSVMVLPGTGKSFDQFRSDDVQCRQFASSQLGGTTAASAATDSGVQTAAVGTLLGAAAGAAINGSSGAGVGAGTGLALGGLIGTSTAQTSAYGVQRRYDIAYQQCMYSMGHRVPESPWVATRRSHSRPVAAPPPPPPGMPPPPPPGMPPAPPPT